MYHRATRPIFETPPDVPDNSAAVASSMDMARRVRAEVVKSLWRRNGAMRVNDMFVCC